MDTLVRDIRHALRRLAGSPGFTGVVVLTLAVAVGANTAVFSVVDRVLLDPLPFPEADRLVVVHQVPEERPDARMEVSYADFLDWREATPTFRGMAAHSTTLQRVVWEVGGRARRVRRALVSPGFFSVLGVPPMLGRGIRDADDRAGAEQVAVVSHGFWREELVADPDVLGRRLTLDGVPHTIVGVAAAGAAYPHRAEVWTPIRSVAGDLAEDPDVGFLQVVGRLGATATLAGARADLDGVLDRVTNPGRPASTRAGVALVPLEDELVGAARPTLLMLLAGAGLVLLIACVNVANLLIARSAARRSEIATRRALGAGGARLLREFLIEALLLALAGSLAGAGIAVLGIQPLVALSPDGLYRGGTVTIDGAALAFTALVGAVAALVFAAVPMLGAMGTDVHDALRMGSRADGVGRESPRLSGGLVVAEVALALVLCVSAVLLVRSFHGLRTAELGFDRGPVTTLGIELPSNGYDGAERAHEFFTRLAGRVGGVPGVDDAAGVLIRPLEGPDGFNYSFTIEGREPEEQARYPDLNYEAVTPGYFSAMGIPLLRGRAFDARDRADAQRVVIVSRAVADRFWPEADPVGQRVKWGPPESDFPWMTVVGVVGAARYRALRSASLDVYVPHLQSPWSLNHLVVRSAVNGPEGLAADVRSVVESIEPGAHVVDVASVSELVSRSLRRPRFHTTVLGIFAGVALLLGVVGLYGVVSRSAARRRREVAIRMALGAEPRTIRVSVLRRAAGLAVLGVMLGTAAALAATRVLDGLVYGVSTTDPPVFAGVAAGLLVVALLAADGPARRSTKVDPMRVLQHE